MQQDMGKLMRDAQKSLQKMQQDMAQLQQELAATSIEGKAGGGAVTVTCTGAGDFTAVKISTEAVDPEDIGTLEDLVLTAIRDASQKVQAVMADKGGHITQGLNLPSGLGF
jgi:nucleoid-associated protein EbfC